MAVLPQPDVSFVLNNSYAMLNALDSILQLLAILHNDRRLENLRHAYWTLADRVRTAIHTQIGDRARLQEQKAEVDEFLKSLEEVRPISGADFFLISSPHAYRIVI